MSDSYDEKIQPTQKDGDVSFLADGIDTISQRLDELRGSLSYKAFGESVGISESGMRKYFPPYLSMPTLDKALRIARTYNVNLEWLASGHGPKFIGEQPSGDVARQAKEKAACYSRDELDEEYVLVPGYHLEVSTGSGCVWNGEEVKRHLAFRRKWLNYRKLNQSNLAVVFAKGDSMEPTIHSGDSILVDTSKTTIQDGSIFVLRLGDDLYAKRLQKAFDGGIIVISDNKAEYPIQTVPTSQLDNLVVIGKVVWIGHDVY